MRNPFAPPTAADIAVIAAEYEMTVHIRGSRPVARCVLGLYGWHFTWRNEDKGNRLEWNWVPTRTAAIWRLNEIAARYLVVRT